MPISTNKEQSVGVLIKSNPLDQRIGIYKASRLVEWANLVLTNFGDIDVFVSAHPRVADPKTGVAPSPTLAAAMEDGDDVLVVVAGMMEVGVE